MDSYVLADRVEVFREKEGDWWQVYDLEEERTINRALFLANAMERMTEYFLSTIEEKP